MRIRTSLTFFFSCIISLLGAQPVITSCGNNRTEGDYVNYFVVNCETVGIQPGNGGSNLTWDYSGLASLNATLQSEQFAEPSNTPYGNFYPNSNIASVANSAFYGYLNYQFNDLSNHGYYTSQYCEILTNPESFIQCPQYYQGSFTDTYAGYNCIGEQINGTKTVRYDGYGTLILPTDTLENIVRLHVFDTLDRAGTLTYEEQHLWFDQSLNFVWLQMVQSTSFSVTNTYVFYLDILNLSLNDEEIASSANSAIYPNPMVDVLNVRVDLHSPVSAIQIMDLSGNLALQAPLSQAASTIDVSTLAQGMYIYRILGRSWQILDQGKIVKE